MQFKLPESTLATLLPSEPGLSAHCRRVSTIAREIAMGFYLPARILTALEQAALLHHNFALLRSDVSSSRQDNDVPSGTSGTHAGAEHLPEELTAVLSAFHAFPATTEKSHVRTAAEVLVLANFMDEQIEFLPFEPKPMEDVWNAVDEMAKLFQPKIIEALRKTFRSWKYVLNTAVLPVQLHILKELLRALNQNQPPEVNQLAELAAQDPVISASILQVANSALHAKRNEIRTIRQGIAYLGTDASRQLMMALSIRPMFASSHLKKVWQHSVWAGQFLRGFAKKHGVLDPEEALLLGLIHDIGRIAIQTIPAAIAELGTRLTEGGCPMTYTEQMLFGMDHGELGSALLLMLGFPEYMIDAVRFHHRPAETSSTLASALYLTEFWSKTDEDLPSTVHLNSALCRLQCSLQDLSNLQENGPVFDALLRVS